MPDNDRRGRGGWFRRALSGGGSGCASLIACPAPERAVERREKALLVEVLGNDPRAERKLAEGAVAAALIETRSGSAIRR